MVESAQDRAGSDGADALNWTPEPMVKAGPEVTDRGS
jgi:hypothetical protein